MKWVFLVIAIMGEVVATSALKASEGFTKLLPGLVTVVGYCVTFYFFSLALRDIPVAVAYAVWSGIGIIFISCIGVFVFKQSIDLPGLVGIGLILAGVVVVNLFSKMGGH